MLERMPIPQPGDLVFFGSHTYVVRGIADDGVLVEHDWDGSRLTLRRTRLQALEGGDWVWGEPDIY